MQPEAETMNFRQTLNTKPPNFILLSSIQQLIDLLTLEKIDDCLFRGDSLQTPWGRVFGGQVLGQALNAAYQTVPDDRLCHSFHGYFILAGDVKLPIIYKVETLRDGGSFTTRRVTASQKGEVIFTMAASFQLLQDGLDHQVPMPNVLPPDSLLPDYKLAESLKDVAPDIYKRILSRQPNPIEFRPVERFDPFNPFFQQPYRHVWMQVKEEMDMTLPMHHQLLAYASDYDLLTTSLLPHVKEMDITKVFLASLDHAMYFHRDFRFDDWLLYAIDSPSASGSRGFSRGNIFDKNGRLVASVVQEGLVRQMRT